MSYSKYSVTIIKNYVLQRKYLVKFSTDGAVLTNCKGAVQGTIRVYQVDDKWNVLHDSSLPPQFHQEILVYYYVGQ